MEPRPGGVPANSAQDTATGGWRWQTFFVEAAVDVNDLRFGAQGPSLPGNSSAFVQPLFDPFQTPVVNRDTSPITGEIVNYPLYSFPVASVRAGDYKMGYACTTPTGVVDSFYERLVRVTVDASIGGGQITWTTRFSDLSPAPSIGQPSSGEGFALIPFVVGAGVGGVSQSFEATAIALDGGATVSASGTTPPIVIPGLVNGSTYRITVTASNSFGTSAPSAPVFVTPSIGLQPPVRPNFTKGAPGSGEATITWTAPTNVPPTGYTVTVSPPPTAPAADTYILGPADTSQVVLGLDPNIVYTFALQPSYEAPRTGISSLVFGSVDPSSIIQQRITVNRPVGQLILTQRCGVNGNIPIFTGTSTIPGFPTELAGDPVHVRSGRDVA